MGYGKVVGVANDGITLDVIDKTDVAASSILAIRRYRIMQIVRGGKLLWFATSC